MYVCVCVCVFACVWTEISSRTDVNVEGDKRLDKLESFLDKLHSKGVTLILLVFYLDKKVVHL